MDTVSNAPLTSKEQAVQHHREAQNLYQDEIVQTQAQHNGDQDLDTSSNAITTATTTKGGRERGKGEGEGAGPGEARREGRRTRCGKGGRRVGNITHNCIGRWVCVYEVGWGSGRASGGIEHRAHKIFALDGRDHGIAVGIDHQTAGRQVSGSWQSSDSGGRIKRRHQIAGGRRRISVWMTCDFYAIIRPDVPNTGKDT